MDNGATWEWVGSAFLLLAPLASAASGGTLAAGLAQCVPYLRAAFGCVYLFAAIAKLNPDYFDYTVSSNTAFTIFVLVFYVGSSAPLPDAAWALALRCGMYVLEAWEFAIPLFLWTHTPTGVALNWLFHLGVGAAAYDFSAAGMATLPILLNPDALEAAYGFMSTSPASRVAWVVLAIAIAAPEQAPVAAGPKSPWDRSSTERIKTQGVWFAWSLLLGAGILRQMAAPVGDDEPAGASTAVAAVCAPLAAFMIFVGLCPYVGVKVRRGRGRGRGSE